MPQSSVKRLLAPMVASCLAACGEPAGYSAMRDRNGRSNQLAVSEPIDLGTLGGSISMAIAVNSSGQIVGMSSMVGYAQNHAFAWQSSTGMVDLGTLGGTYSSAASINAAGQIVGQSTLTNAFSAPRHAVLWQIGSPGITDLGTLGGTWSYASYVNDAGQVIGMSQTANGQSHAFLWQGGKMIDLGTLGAWESRPLAMNALGQVVGESSLAGTTYRSGAFLWQSATGMIGLESLGAFPTTARAINDRGQIVGDGALPAGSEDRQHALLWESGTGMTDLRTLCVASFVCGLTSSAFAINARGQVVGTSDNGADDVWSHAFIWERDTGMIDLGTLGGEYSTAYAVNARGQVVGWSGITGNGQSHAFLWQSGTGMIDLGTLDGGSSSAVTISERGHIVGSSTTAKGLQLHAVLWNTIRTPAEQLADLSDAVASLGAAGKLNKGQMNALQAKLDAAGRQLDGAKKTAANVLRAFTNQVQAFVSASILSSSNGQMLIDAAQALINQLST
jgi:probable HAF family extracellular repeat protein